MPGTPGTLTKLLVIAFTVEVCKCDQRTNRLTGVGARQVPRLTLVGVGWGP